MGLLIDSSIFIALERRSVPFDALQFAAPDEPVALASITASELLVGVHRADTDARRQLRASAVEAILQVLPILPFDEGVARIHAQVWAQLLAAGRMIGAHDLLIAATAVQHRYTVLTDNVRDFRRVPGLSVLQPTW